MKGNTEEIHIGSEGELFKYIIIMQGHQQKQGVKNKIKLYEYRYTKYLD